MLCCLKRNESSRDDEDFPNAMQEWMSTWARMSEKRLRIFSYYTINLLHNIGIAGYISRILKNIKSLIKMI